jgi:CRISPR-associated protein Cmr5
MARTMDQQRAKSAWDNLVDVNHEGDDFKKGYRNSARSAALMVMTAGLGQTLAFLRARGASEPGKPEKPEMRLYEHISDWVGQEVEATDSLLEWVIDQEVDVYRRATTETLAYLGWLKRFAEATLPQPDEMGE